MDSLEPTIIIAEAGVNHNGDIDIARKLIDAAQNAGADYVKFQTFNTDKLVSPKAKKAAYQQKSGDKNEITQQNMLARLEFTEDEFSRLKDYCDQSGIGFLSTAFDLDSIYFLDSLDLDYIKIPSGEITNRPYLECIAELGKPVLLSTGMATLQEIDQALRILQVSNSKKEGITVLHCTSAYPAPTEEVNLRAMQTIAETFDVGIGYSDHTLGIEVPATAVAMGAIVLEKHLTLDKNMDGPDHEASLEPDEFAEMVERIRLIEKARGDGQKRPMPSETENRIVARKSIHLSTGLEKGAKIKADDLVMLRPGDGISPMKMEKVVGAVTKRALEKGDKLQWDDLS